MAPVGEVILLPRLIKKRSKCQHNFCKNPNEKHHCIDAECWLIQTTQVFSWISWSLVSGIAQPSRHERYKLENIIVVGILPGHSEPKLTANTFPEPLVRELQTLWTWKERFSIYGSLFKRPIKVGLVCVSSDILATRKIGGFFGHMAAQGCSRCKKNFYSGDGLDFSGFDRENWQPRNSSEHKYSAKQTLEETSPTAQQKLCSELGARYSVLQELEYFDCVHYFVVDPMHNLYSFFFF